jgi:hypothetical protein
VVIGRPVLKEMDVTGIGVQLGHGDTYERHGIISVNYDVSSRLGVVCLGEDLRNTPRK